MEDFLQKPQITNVDKVEMKINKKNVCPIETQISETVSPINDKDFLITDSS